MAKPEVETKDPNKGVEIFRPYARLISILGDQLITTKWVGVIELVKNCYDADATNVTVRFLNFDILGQSPVIEIEDDGDGMTIDTILNVWMKPATPNKLNRKKSKDSRYTKKGRLMQGDKGVGRFAIYKLGNNVEIFTKTKDSREVHLTLNFREYAQNDEFAEEEAVPERFLDEIKNAWEINNPPVYIKNKEEKGTLIRISDLRNNWKEDDLEKLQIAFQRMIPPVIPNFKEVIVRDFDINLLWNDVPYPTAVMTFEKIIALAPFSFEGEIDENGFLTYLYSHNKKGSMGGISLLDNSETETHDVWKLPKFRDQFLEFIDVKETRKQIKIKKVTGDEIPKKSYWKVRRVPVCGPCSFFFYAFDWKNKLELHKYEETFIKDNSVYLYRDYTRVYPYGEKGVDWLLLSKLRAEDRAGRYFSYNDLFGFIFITQVKNPDLRDAASREGLININGALDDFIALIQASLKIMKDFVDVDKRKDEIRKEKVFTTANKKFQEAFEQLKSELIKLNSENSLIKAQKFFNATNNLIAQYKDKLTISEELAGLGMAVEKSSHDLFMLIRKLIQNSNDIVSKFDKGKLSAANLKLFFDDLIENLEFLYQELQIFEPLFRTTRKVTKDISVRETIERVQRYYQRELKFNINFKIEGSGDIIVKTNFGLMLQVFINLIDNAIYWLNQKNRGKREIIVRIDAVKNQVIVADNGPGIDEDRAEIIFLEFYSTKADGRGLGLYIIKELLERINAEIALITTEDIKIMPGANFLIQFDEVN